MTALAQSFVPPAGWSLATLNEVTLANQRQFGVTLRKCAVANVGVSLGADAGGITYAPQAGWWVARINKLDAYDDVWISPDGVMYSTLYCRTLGQIPDGTAKAAAQASLDDTARVVSYTLVLVLTGLVFWTFAKDK
jgi:hypothetical protein